jgi:hypothetical protein
MLGQVLQMASFFLYQYSKLTQFQYPPLIIGLLAYYHSLGWLITFSILIQYTSCIHYRPSYIGVQITYLNELWLYAQPKV